MTCLPSFAPMQFGKFHHSSGSAAIFLLSSLDGTGICIGDRTSQFAVQTSNIIFCTVDTPILKLYTIVVTASPTVRYLCSKTIYDIKFSHTF